MTLYRTFLLLAFLSISRLLLGQQFGNEWINYNQSYYSFKITTTGVFKIDYATLAASSVPMTSFTTENIQLFGREKEIPIYLEDGGDSSFDPGDYLLFYAEQNDGWLDTSLYASSGDIGNPKYSLYNDTIHYFFTWNNSTTNLRFLLDTATNIGAYNASNFIVFERFQSYSSNYNEGEKNADASSSFFTSGEGWGSAPVNGAAGYTWNFSSTSLEQLYQGTDAPPVEYNAVSVGVSNANFTGTGNHHVRHTIGSSNYVLSDSIFTGYKAIHIKKTFPVSVLPPSGSSNFKVSIIGDQGAITDFQSINYWSFLYPRKPNLSGLQKSTFQVSNAINQNKIRLDISNITGNTPLFFSLGSQPKKLSYTFSNGIYSVLIPNNTNATSQKIIYQASNSVITIDKIFPVNGTGQFTNYSNVNTENALIMVYHPALQAASVDYATYRATHPNGGNFNVVLANVNELYLQYGGGIDKHIHGIRRFSHQLHHQSTAKPVGLFLMGKGIREANIVSLTSTGPGSRTNALHYANSLIPSFGQPSSDACITSNLPGTTKWVPLIPTGRISVQNNQELANYLTKVKAFEENQKQNSIYSTTTKDWQKQVLHFSGGTDANQQFTFKTYLSILRNKIANQFFGANVETTAKVSNAPLDPGEINAIMDRIQNGVSLITFFGHAAATNSGFEINIDEPSLWNNPGKYPLILTNSCYNGNIFQNGVSKSEEFVNPVNSGAIGYIGVINLGFSNTLFQYSSKLYDQFSTLGYGQSLGQQMKSTISSLEVTGANLFTESTCLQMTLNGDPMLKLNWHAKPEIEILPENISFQPENLNLTVDSIEMQVVLKNLGKSIADTFLVEITRKFPTANTDSVYLFLRPSLHYTDTIRFKMPLQPNIGIGINSFTVKVDIPTFIDEQYDELNNNQLVKTLFINIEGIQPVLPANFAVVPKDSVTVIASTINPIAPFATYRFEIDTIDFVGSPSPFHRYALISGLGGIKQVNPSEWLSTQTGQPAPLICTDSTVYFWRVSLDSPSPIWQEHSFQYIPEKQGWGQAHFYQFKNNSLEGILYDRQNRIKNFGPNIKQLTCSVKATTSIPGIYFNEYTIDGIQKEYGICQYTPSFYVAVIDPINLTPWGTRYGTANPTNNFGNANDNGACRNRVENYFIFRQNDPNQMTNFQNMMNAVPNGHYILVYSPMTTLFNQLAVNSPQLFNTFQNLGSDSIVVGRPNMPFAFFCKKGDASSVVELFAQQNGEDVDLTADLIASDYLGQESTPLIGPSSKWGSVFWKQTPSESNSADTTVLYIKAYNSAGVLQQTIENTFTPNDSIINLHALVDANNFPFLQLSAFYKDSITFTPAQINRWHVLYTPLPEAAIDGSAGFTWLPNSDTLTEGENVQFAVTVKNIFTIPMDSLLVRYWIKDRNQITHILPYSRQDSLRVNATLLDTITFSTIGLAGINSLWMEVNPYVNGSLFQTDQPEQAHFNNLLQLPFYVTTDKEHPVLDVTFNGRHILNGDIVSPESEITITLKDENPFLVLNSIADTALFGIYLTDPDGIQTRIPFIDQNGNNVMQCIPAQNENQRFKILYPAFFSKDGKYTLLVQGSDKTGNLSGDIAYKITFEVIHESSITHLMNYPNPFSTSTRFVFTLTGRSVPEEMIIQIMTVSGKVVREITEDELGPIQIGRNITQYAWDGKDEFGDPLANGVYLYRVKATIQGESIKHLESGADSYFTKEFGKMYLFR
jgi:hypothetical protein